MDNWSRVEELFQAALAQPREKRTAYLRSICPDDEKTHREVLELLHHVNSKDGFLEGSPLTSLATPAVRLTPAAILRQTHRKAEARAMEKRAKEIESDDGQARLSRETIDVNVLNPRGTWKPISAKRRH